MLADVKLPIREGEAFHYNDSKLIFHRKVGERLLVTDQTNEVVLVYDDDLDAEAMPRVSWFLHGMMSSAIRFTSRAEDDGDRFDHLQRLDLLGAVLRDPASLWRFSWARAAKKAGLAKSEASIRNWIGATHPLAVPPLPYGGAGARSAGRIHAKLAKAFGKRPSPRTIMVWMDKLDAGATVSSFVNRAGRPLGHSQLPAKTNRLVERGVELYWEDRETFPNAEVCAGLIEGWWRILEGDGAEDIGADPPVYETIRRRLRATENFENYAKRYGAAAALDKFRPKGEPIEVSRPFERVYLDGTVFRHLTRYSDEFQEVAGKMRGVCAMDAFSLYKWRYAVGYGPFRGELALEALMNVFLLSQRVEAADLEADPTLLIHGVPVTVAFDNSRADLPPSSVPSLMQMCEVELIDIYHSDGKSPLEASFKHDKAYLAGLRGLVLPPGRKKDPRYKPAEEADMTKAQYEVEIERARLEWNRTPKASLGDRSPNEVMLEYIVTQGVQRLDP